MNEDTQFNPQTPPTGIPPVETPQEEKHHNGFGPLAGIAIIIAVLLFGGFYFWGAQLNTDTPSDMDQNEVMGDTDLPNTGFTQDPADEITEQLQSQGTSLDPLDIEDDINATDLGDFEAELDNLDSIFAQ